MIRSSSGAAVVDVEDVVEDEMVVEIGVDVEGDDESVESSPHATARRANPRATAVVRANMERMAGKLHGPGRRDQTSTTALP